MAKATLKLNSRDYKYVRTALGIWPETIYDKAN